MRPADRIAHLKPYFFAQLNPFLADLRQRGVDVIRLDVGSPDLPPPDFILQELVTKTQRADMHGYQPYGGTQAYRQAIVTYYQRRFGVALHPYQEVVGLIGSKEGIFNLSQAILNPGDLVLIPEPGYPTYTWGADIAGAELLRLPLLAENGFLPDFDRIPNEVAQRAKVVWLNYPNNPTGAVADLDFFESAIEFARRHDLLVVHDAPYLEISYDGYRAPSILQVENAREVAIEFNSLSKTYNMAGWRLGMAVGNQEVIGYLHELKTKIDTSHFGPILAAGACALTADQDWIADRNQIYQDRRNVVVAGLTEMGFTVHPPQAALYVWARLPVPINEVDYCRRLLEATGVSITPGTVYGASGAGYVRLSLCTATEKISEAMGRFVEWSGEVQQ